MIANGTRPRILLVEDNAGDVRLLRHALRDTKVPHQLDVVDDGEEAMGFLLNQGPHRDVARPDLILLDLNLPRKTGFEVLRDLKADDRLKRIPVIILTSSESEVDVNTAYDCGCSLYFRKPSNLDEIEELARVITDGWLRLAVLPSDGKSRC